MGQKRALILSAAREAFLGAGFEGASMEAIAAAAGVSIMTLYRHARTKDDLFEAVVSEACAPPVGSEEARAIETILQQPLGEILTFIGIRFQKRLAEPQALGLLRAVIIEHRHFPHLSELVYEGLVASHARQLTDFLGKRPEAAALNEERCAMLSADFVDRLLGADLLKALLGISVSTDSKRESRARQAAEALAAGLKQLSAG
ncbi:TetR/AcrR family transcriptional regulator [Novosphingopyxis sp.]|uniref:TetR/AcrR family transcriptional regulator n=1 Tax=Novosphingopyxis sp. TaxID=2709690 RepID=UPI003B594655